MGLGSRLRRSVSRVTTAARRVAQNPLVQTFAPMAIGMPPGSLQLLKGAMGQQAAEAVAEEYAPMVSEQFPTASQTLLQARGVRESMRSYRPRRAAPPPPPVEEEEEEEYDDYDDYDEDEEEY